MEGWCGWPFLTGTIEEKTSMTALDFFNMFFGLTAIFAMMTATTTTRTTTITTITMIAITIATKIIRHLS